MKSPKSEEFSEFAPNHHTVNDCLESEKCSPRRKNQARVTRTTVNDTLAMDFIRDEMVFVQLSLRGAQFTPFQRLRPKGFPFTADVDLPLHRDRGPSRRRFSHPFVTF